MVMPVFVGGRARRLLRDQGALARHRRQGSVLDGHGRRLPGGHDLPRRQAVRGRAAGRGHLPLRDRQLARAEDGRRRHQRDRRRRAHRAPRRSRGSSSGTGSSASARARRASTRTARRSCGAGSSSCRTGATSATARWTRTASTTTPCRSTSSSRSRARTCGSTTPARRRSRRARSTARCPRPSRPAASRSRCWPAAARRRTRATSARSRWSRGEGTLFHPLHPAPCFLYGWAGDQAIEAIYRARRRRAARGRARLQRRRHLRARLVGRARGHRRAVDGRRAAPDRPGRARGRRRREQPDARLRGRHADHAGRGVGGEEPVADRALRARARLLRAGPRSAAGSDSTSTSRCARTRGSTSTVERTKNAPWGLAGGGEARAEQRVARAARRHASRASARSPGCWCRAARPCACAPAAAAATATRPSATRRRCTPTSRDGYVSEEHARAALPARVRGRARDPRSGASTIADVPALARGCAILGTGGGGEVYTGSLILLEALRVFGPVEVVDARRSSTREGLLLPLGMIGAPDRRRREAAERRRGRPAARSPRARHRAAARWR